MYINNKGIMNKVAEAFNRLDKRKKTLVIIGLAASVIFLLEILRS